MKFDTYKEIKKTIADYVTRLDKLQYKGYEEDKAYLKGLCTQFQRTVGDEAEKVIKDHLDDFRRYLEYREFHVSLKNEITYKNIIALKKLAFYTDEKTYESVNKLLNDYVNLMWYYYGKELDADLVLSMLRINERVSILARVLIPSNEVKVSR